MLAGERRAELDGVRGVAILLVLVGHAFDGLEPLAAAGVALFFTLSGYLITSLLLAECERHGRLRLRRFYARRVTRLAPPMFAMLAVVGGLAEVTPGQVAAVGLWVANYAALTMSINPFPHAWSLAVEEQFYVVWPLLLLALLRRRHQVALLLGVVVVLTCWRLLLVGVGASSYAYVALETAGVLILAGCLIALARWRLSGRLAGLALTAMMAACGVVAVAEWPWMVAPVVVMPAAVVLVASARGCRWLSWPLLGFCGTSSYSVYLWHVPVSLLVAGELTPWGVAAGAAAGLVAFAAVERPVMRWRARGTPLESADEVQDPTPDPSGQRLPVRSGDARLCQETTYRGAVTS